MRKSAGSSEFNSQNNVSSTEESPSRISVFPSLSSCRRRNKELREFTLAELKTATKNFSRSAMLGEGGFGCVYRGSVVIESQDSNKRIDVAVKQGHKEWVTEVNVLGVVDHPNLVKLVGYCAEDDERGIQRLLVYEYLANRSVQDRLSSRFLSPLPWSARLKIAQDAARGLAYLHEGMDFQIIFRDFKSSNILLDEQWKVGTVGYAAPEYIQTGRLTAKSDVWSYGVLSPVEGQWTGTGPRTNRNSCTGSGRTLPRT
nr:serine/threonine-protein kinase PCRK1 isoform X2 [Ipomoea batatas]